MRFILNLILGRQEIDHRAVFGAFASGLARVIARSARRARVRAV